MDSVVYLRFKVDHQGLHIIETTTNAIQNAPPQKNVSELKSFLGMVNHCNHFATKCATLWCHQWWTWSTKGQHSVKAIKAALSSAKGLIHYDQQNINYALRHPTVWCGSGPFKPVTFGWRKPTILASRTMSQVEKKYSQLDREVLAIMFGVK